MGRRFLRITVHPCDYAFPRSSAIRAQNGSLASRLLVPLRASTAETAAIGKTKAISGLPAFSSVTTFRGPTKGTRIATLNVCPLRCSSQLETAQAIEHTQ